MERFDPGSVQRHFDAIAERYDEGKARQPHYWHALVRIYQELVPAGATVLEVGCGTGSLLANLSPRRGAGLDISPAMVTAAKAKYPELEFWAEDIARPTRRDAFEFILLCDVLEHLPDPDSALEGLKSYADGRTLFVATAANPLWAGPLHLAEALRWKLPEGNHEWMSLKQLRGLLDKHGFLLEAAEGRILLPFRVPWAGGWLDRLARLRALRALAFTYAVVFRLR